MGRTSQKLSIGIIKHLLLAVSLAMNPVSFGSIISHRCSTLPRIVDSYSFRFLPAPRRLLSPSQLAFLTRATSGGRRGSASSASAASRKGNPSPSSPPPKHFSFSNKFPSKGRLPTPPTPAPILPSLALKPLRPGETHKPTPTPTEAPTPIPSPISPKPNLNLKNKNNHLNSRLGGYVNARSSPSRRRPKAQQRQYSGSGAAPAGGEQFWDSEQRRYDLKKIEEALVDRTEQLGHAILGEPNLALSSDIEERYGNKGSLVITTQGSYRGRWYDFETGEGGGPLQLISKANGTKDFKETLHWAVRFIDGNVADVDTASINQRQRRGFYTAEGRGRSQTPGSHTQQNYTTKEQRREKIKEFGLKLYLESRPIAGTIAEKYLREHRGIVRGVNARSIRFHPSVLTGKINNNTRLPTLIAVARDDKGDVQSIQATYLDPETAGKRQGLTIPKRTYGTLKGALVQISTPQNSTVTFVAEGVETALSIAEVTEGARVIATLGKHNFKNIAMHQTVGDKVVLCVDNDGNATFADGTISQAVASLADMGKTVYIAMSAEEKTDFNDVLLKPGDLRIGREELTLELNKRRRWEEIPKLKEAVQAVRERDRIRRERQAGRYMNRGPGTGTNGSSYVATSGEDSDNGPGLT